MTPERPRQTEEPLHSAWERSLGRAAFRMSIWAVIQASLTRAAKPYC